MILKMPSFNMIFMYSIFSTDVKLQTAHIHSLFISGSSFCITWSNKGKKFWDINVSICFCVPAAIFDKIQALSFLIDFLD